MKIIDVAELYSEKGGGIKTYIHQKLSAGHLLGHEIVIIAPGPEDEEMTKNAGRIIFIKSPLFPLDSNYYLFCKTARYHEILDREKPDVVESSSAWGGGLAVAKWKGKAVKSFLFHQDPVAYYPQTFLGNILGNHNVDRLFFWYWSYLRRLSASYDLTVVSGGWLAERLKRFNIKRPETVSFGVDKVLFSPSKKSEEIKQKLLLLCGVPPEAKLFICISRHSPEKHLGAVIKGFSMAAKNNSLGLVIFGDGPLRNWVGKWAKQGKNVYLAGFTSKREEIASALASADYLLHGCAAETYGLVIAEAICSGLPVVVPSIGGAADLAKPEYSELYAAGNIKSCAEAIERLLLRDRKSMAEAALKAAEKNIGTAEDHFKTLFALYEKLVSNLKTNDSTVPVHCKIPEPV